MAQVRFNSIKVKTSFWVGLCMVLTLGFVVAYGAVHQRQMIIESTETELLADGEAIANYLKAQIDVPLDAARTLGQVLSSVDTSDPDRRTGVLEDLTSFNRAQVNAMLREITVQNPEFIGTYTLWEPNAFDGRDLQYAGNPPHDHTGRFMAYWNRGETGKIRVETLQDYELEGAGDYYQIPKKRERESIIEPYLYPVQGKEVLMTSLVVPVMKKGVFQGIVGVDMGVEELQAFVREHNPYPGQADVTLISHGGVISASSGNGDDIGKHMRNKHEDWQEDLQIIRNGEKILQRMTENIDVFLPVHIGKTQTPWSVNISMPTSVIMARATRVMWQMIGIGFGCILIALALIWVVVSRVSQPIITLTEVARQVGEGDLEVTAHVDTGDETGLLAGAFNQMVSNLREKTQKEQQRAQADKEAKQYLESTISTYVKFVEKVGKGDLTASVTPPGRDDELTLLGSHLNKMTGNLRELASQVAEGVRNLSAATTQILAATQEQAATASEQSAAVAQTSSTVDEAGQTARQSSKRAGRVSEMAQSSMKEANMGYGAVRETMEMVGHIKEQVNHIAENILALSEQTQQIGEIIDTVNDIADQSNLLALNATIEAARAGDAGKGFAVVAGEVRSLADQSRQATAKVKDILNEIQKAANSAVMVTEEGIKRADAGVSQAEKAGTAIQTITENIQTVASTIQQIAASTQEQLAGMDQISGAMENISQATQQTEEGTRQVEESAQNLNALGEQLKRIVERYQLH